MRRRTRGKAGESQHEREIWGWIHFSGPVQGDLCGVGTQVIPVKPHSLSPVYREVNCDIGWVDRWHLLGSI